MKTGCFRPRFLFLRRCNVPDPPESRYSPLTAADEKIPLSMGQVNNKPQHLVFSMQTLVPCRQIRSLPLWKPRKPAPIAGLRHANGFDCAAYPAARPLFATSSLCPARGHYKARMWCKTCPQCATCGNPGTQFPIPTAARSGNATCLIPSAVSRQPFLL